MVVNGWTWGLVIGTAVCLAVVWAVPTPRGRGPRGVGLGAVLNNVAKHADATCALVRVHYPDGMLRAEIIDDGNGGADQGNGTGLAGIERRLTAFDGILAVNSPVGGPTIVVIEVPCVLSSPKISIS